MCPRRKYLGSIGLVAAVMFLAAFIWGCSGNHDPLSIEPRSLDPSANSSQQAGVAKPESCGSRVPVRHSSAKQWADNEVVVVLKASIGSSQATSALSAYPLRLIRTVHCRWANVYRLGITDGTPVQDMVNRLKADPSVRIAEPNLIYQLDEAPYVPNDPMWEQGIHDGDPRDSVFDQWGPAKIGAGLVWNEEKGSGDVVVAVIDTGVKSNHEDLAGRLWINEDEIPDNDIDDDGNGWVDDTWGWNFQDDDNDPYDIADYANYHGTACSGIIAATQDNHHGVTGIAPGVKIMAVKIDFVDSGALLTSIIDGLEYAMINGADICSMSFGINYYSEIMELECNDVWNNGDGAVLLASAGNEDSNKYKWPAAYDSVIAVGATVTWTGDTNDPIDETRVTSSLGYDWGSNYSPDQEVMGFGAKYTTTYGGFIDGYWDGTDDFFFAGTSCACPMSAGVVALVKSFNPGHNAQWYRDRLKYTADDLGDVGWDNQTGWGRCNALRAVYGPDRFAEQEDANGFVPLTLPDTQVFDSIHDVPDNPYADSMDLYKIKSDVETDVMISLDIFTWGEDLDLAVYSDPDMTQLVSSSTGPNHFNSSFEETYVHALPGQDYFIKVYSPAPGNSTTYGLKVHEFPNILTVIGENLAPQISILKNKPISILKLTFEVGFQATLDEIVINKKGTLPNSEWVAADIYRDSNDDGQFDEGDQLVLSKSPQARNRARLSDLGLAWNHKKPMVLFFAAEFAQTQSSNTVEFSLESYKDVTTVEGIRTPYAQFPISSEVMTLDADNDPPTWVTTVGAQFANPGLGSATIGFNTAVDSMAPPVKYNLYYTDSLPFSFFAATKIGDIKTHAGTSTDFEATAISLAYEKQWYFVVRAEDQVGNEDDNEVMVSCTPLLGGDPYNPTVIKEIHCYETDDVAFSGDKLICVGGNQNVSIFDRTDPLNPVLASKWVGTDHYQVVSTDGTDAFMSGWSTLTVLGIGDMYNPTQIVAFSYPYGVEHPTSSGPWTYAALANNLGLITVDATDPDNPYVKSTELIGIGYHNHSVVKDGYLYITCSTEGIYVYDLQNPGYPAKVNVISYSNARSVAISGTKLYAMDGAEGIKVWDLGQSPTNPPSLGSIPGPGGSWPLELVAIGDYVYMADTYKGLLVYDATDPKAIQQIASMKFTALRAITNDGPIIYAVGEKTMAVLGLYVIL